MKTHFAEVEKANESDNNNYWSETVCGIESEKVENDLEVVDCKKCLKRKGQYEQDTITAMEHSCNDMAGFVEFMKQNQNNN